MAEIILKPFRKLFSWIRKNITKLLATKRFEQKYRDWLINKCRFLNVRGIKTNAPVAIEIEKVFISLRSKKPSHSYPLSVRYFQREFEIDVNRLYISESAREEFTQKAKGEYEKENIYELKDLFHLLQKKFIVIGAPGSGKTTLLNYLALKFARRSANALFGIEDDILPIFINLRDTIREGFLEVRKFVDNYNNYPKLPFFSPKGFFEKRLSRGECIILLDGLDEVATLEERAIVAKWVDELSTVYSNNLFIATSRPYGYETARFYNDFLELHILDFVPEQVDEFIRYWTKAIEIKVREDESELTLKEAEKHAEELLNAIKENAKIEALAVNPLLLTIVALVHRYRGHLPERRVELYEECCDVLLGHWDRAKGITGELQPRQKRAVLQPLAFHLHRNGIREERREKFVELLGSELPKIGISRDRANDFLDDIKFRCGILVETQLGFFGFTHLTFQEFLTAKHVLDNDLENFLVAQKRHKYWLEVTLLYCGMKDTTNLLQKILKEEDDIFHTGLFLSGRCLVESLSVSLGLRTKITQEMFDVYSNGKEFDQSKRVSLEILKQLKDHQLISMLTERASDKERDVRVSAVLALAQVKVRETVLPLIELLKDKESDVRERAANALGQIQAKEAVLSLIELLRDKEGVVRRCAAYALGQIQAKEAVLPLVELVKDKENDVRWSAALALGQIQSKGAFLPMIDLLEDKDRDVGWRAAIALGQTGSKEVILPLTEVLSTKDIDVRRRAVFALRQVQAQDTVSSLIGLLKDREVYARGHAAFALGQIRATAAAVSLTRCLKDNESFVRANAANALGQLRDREAVPLLIDLLNDKESYVRGSAVESLGQLQAPEAILPLLELVKDKESYVRARAAFALGQIGDKNAIRSLKLLLNDLEFEVRESAFNALKEIFERTGTPIY